MMNTLAKALLIIVLISSASFAESCIANTTDIIIREQGTNIAIVIALSTLVIALAYMVGSLIGATNLIVFSKDELFHLAFSIGLLVGFSGLMLSSCQITDFFFKSTFTNLNVTTCYSEGTGVAGVASCFLTQMQSKASQMSSQYMHRNIDLLMSSSFSIAIPIPLANALTVVAGSYKRVLSQQYDMVLNSFLLPVLMSISMQKFLLDFINENVISWVLPIAFLLRIFIPTRHMGNILIALSVGLYVVIPLFYTLNFAMYSSVVNDCTSYSAATNDIYFGYGCDAYGFYELARLVPQAFFLPNLTIALFITFMSAVNKALRVIG